MEEEEYNNKGTRAEEGKAKRRQREDKNMRKWGSY